MESSHFEGSHPACFSAVEQQPAFSAPEHPSVTSVLAFLFSGQLLHSTLQEQFPCPIGNCSDAWFGFMGGRPWVPTTIIIPGFLNFSDRRTAGWLPGIEERNYGLMLVLWFTAAIQTPMRWLQTEKATRRFDA